MFRFGKGGVRFLKRRNVCVDDPLAHDTDWHDQLDDVRNELTARRTHRAMRDQLHADRAESGQTSGPQGE